MRKIIFMGQQETINFTKSTKKRDIKNGIANLAATAYLGQQTIRSGVPRLLGVRLESHSTSKKNAKEILKNGGILDPNYGGTGASKALNDKHYINQSKNYVHLTGRHKDDIGKTTLLKDLIHRKRQRAMYRGLPGEDINTKDVGKIARNLLKGLTGVKGKTLYLGGSDNYFNKNFISDPSDIALKTSNKVRVHGNRTTATLEALKREGNGDRLKGISKLVKANPKRALAGVAILTVGTGLTSISAKDTYNSFNGKVKGHTRKNKSGKWSNVKSFIRDKIKK